MNTRSNNPSQQPQQQQQGGTSATSQQGATSPGSSSGSAQQNQYAPAGQQQGGTRVTPRGQGRDTPSIWGRRGGPFEWMRQMDEDMDRMFRQLWGGGRSLARARGSAEPGAMWMPQVEVFERDGRLHVHADLPGMRKEDVTLQIDNDQLVIQGERRSSHEETQAGGYFHSERSYGSFYRSIPLPEGVDADTAEASFKDGVLRVNFALPRQPQLRSRKLDIRDES